MQPQKNGKNVQKYSAYFVLLNCFSLVKNILVQTLNSPVHSSDKTILWVLCASLAYMGYTSPSDDGKSYILEQILKTVKFKWPVLRKKVNTTWANVYWLYSFTKSFNKYLNPVKRDAVCSNCIFCFSWNIFIEAISGSCSFSLKSPRVHVGLHWNANWNITNHEKGCMWLSVG